MADLESMQTMYLGVEFQAGDSEVSTTMSIMSAGIEDLPDLIVPRELKDFTTCTSGRTATSCFGSEEFLLVNVRTGVLYHARISVVTFTDKTKTVTQISFSARGIDRDELVKLVHENHAILQWIYNDLASYKPLPLGEIIAKIMRRGLQLVDDKYSKFKKVVEEHASTYASLYRKVNGEVPSREEVEAKINEFYNVDIRKLVEEANKGNAWITSGFRPVRV